MAKKIPIIGIAVMLIGIFLVFSPSLGIDYLFSAFENTNPDLVRWDALGDTPDLTDSPYPTEEQKIVLRKVINNVALTDAEIASTGIQDSNGGFMGLIDYGINRVVFSGTNDKWTSFKNACNPLLKNPFCELGFTQTESLEASKEFTVMRSEPINEMNIRYFFEHRNSNDKLPLEIGFATRDFSHKCSMRVSDGHLGSSFRVMQIEFNVSDPTQMAVGFGKNLGEATAGAGNFDVGKPDYCFIESSEPIYPYMTTGAIFTKVRGEIIELPLRIKEVNVTVTETQIVEKQIIKLIDSQGNVVQEVVVEDEDIPEEGKGQKILGWITFIGGAALAFL